MSMLPLYRDPWFTFRFKDSRTIDRVHIEGIEPSAKVSIFKIDPITNKQLGLLGVSVVGEGGWVVLPKPIVVETGDAFIVVPEGDDVV